jgi:hypothetical protein
MNATETRIIRHSSLTADYAFVSMPKTAWYWLDDLVRKHYPAGGYRALLKRVDDGAGCAETLSFNLRRKAQEHCETQMTGLYKLANDNQPANGYGDLKRNPALPANPDLSVRMPSVYQLFRFMPHATYLTTVWERLNYHLKG